ncbi:hypothetical protein OAG65_02985, partial [Akkermansiaceae bacterium]|nr:hypothetical protein [Akkermansiaceae bacterium]
PLVSYELSMRSVSEMIDSEPERAKEARSQLAYLYFMSAEFTKAKPHFQVNPKRMRGLAKVNESLAGSFDPDEHQTSAIQLADIIKRVQSMNRIALAGKILSFDYASLGYREGYELAVAAMFGDHSDCFSYEAETQTLTINGGGKSFSLRTKEGQNPLRFLSIKRLILIDTMILNSSEIADLKMLEEADLRGSQISLMGDLNMFPQLKRLIVRPDQLSREEKNRLRSLVQVE